MFAFNIQWDGTNEEIENLPKEIELPDYLFDEDGNYDEDKVSDYLSDITGFCHKGFELDLDYM